MVVGGGGIPESQVTPKVESPGTRIISIENTQIIFIKKGKYLSSQVVPLCLSGVGRAGGGEAFLRCIHRSS